MMNSSAKILFTLVAAGALGAVAIACTVSSGTVDDFDGGSSSGQASSSGNTDSGTDTGTGTTSGACPSLTYNGTIDSVECDTCLQQKCCTETAGCYNRADNDDAGALGCEGWNTQLLDCDKNENSDDCKKLARSAAQPGIPEAWNAYLGCRETNCATACGDTTAPPPDGGAP